MALRRELLGWYSYSWAAEPFVVCAVGTYVPILLEQFARENAVRVDDYLTPCTEFDVPDPGVGPPVPGQPHHKCVVPFLGTYIDTSSLALYTFSLSVLLQTLVVISMSGAADRGSFRKRLLVGFALVGGLFTCGFLFVTPHHYYIAALLAMGSNAAFGAVSVCGNAFLPVLVDDQLEAASQNAQLAEGLDSSGEPSDSPVSGLLGSYKPTTSAELAQISSRISGTGVAVGYLSALIVQIATMLLIVFLTKSNNTVSPGQATSTFGIQLSIFIVGLWWIVFQIPVAFLLSSRLGPPLHQHHHTNHSVLWVFYGYIIYGWRTLFATFRKAREMRDVAIFLLGWFIISDAITTINSAAVLFARAELQMSAPSLAIIGVLAVFSGMFGAKVAPRLRGASGNPSNAIVLIIFIAAAIPLYGLVGFVSKSVGLRNPWEMYLLAVWYGFALGGLSATCRSVFSLLIPKGKESTFFSLYSVTDKGSSIIGPTITGIITDKTHNIRYTFYFLFLMMLLAAAVFHFLLDIDRGREEARILEQVGDESDSDAE